MGDMLGLERMSVADHRQTHRPPRAGIDHVVDRINPGTALPPDTEVAELITMLVRFRTQAVSAVSATLAFSIESTIESAVGQILGDFIEKEAPPEA